MKKCYHCQKIKNVFEFHKNKRKKDGYSHCCKSCDNQAKQKSNKKIFSVAENKTRRNLYSAKYRTNNPEKVKYSKRKFYLNRYNMSLQDYENLLHSQNSKCKICKKKCPLVVDHNHLTGNVRALLCNNCNTGLGLINESVENLKNMLKYLEKYNNVCL